MKPDLPVRPMEIKAWRQLAMAERERRLDQADHTSGAVQMAEVRFCRADCTKLLLVRIAAERFHQAFHFNRIAKFRSVPCASIYEIVSG